MDGVVEDAAPAGDAAAAGGHHDRAVLAASRGTPRRAPCEDQRVTQTVRLSGALTGVVVASAALAAAYGPGYAGYDAAWALVWGGDLAGGNLPSYGASFAPTPHPLIVLVSVPLSLFPDGGERAAVLMSFMSLALLGVASFSLGDAIIGRIGGIAAAVFVLTRGDLGRAAAYASVDVPFLALVVAAVAFEVRRPKHGTGALSLLAVAGLMRPEAWGIALAEAAWCATAAPRRPARTVRLFAGALAAPVLWALTDLLITGDPLHSLNGTRELAAELDRPRGLGTAWHAVGDAVPELIGGWMAAAGLAGAVALAWRHGPRVVPPVAAAVLALITFLAIGLADLPVLFRYLFVPSVMLCVLAGAGAAMTMSERDWPGRLAGAVVMICALAAVPGTVNALNSGYTFTHVREPVYQDLRDLAGSPAFLRAARRCGRVLVPDFRTRPVLLLEIGGRPERLEVGNLPDGEAGLLLTYGSQEAADTFSLGSRGGVRRQARPVGARDVATNASWKALAVC